MKTEIIAEVGECFNGNFNQALQMISKAKQAGCDTVKFQLLDMSEVAFDDPEYDWFSKLEIDLAGIRELIKKADQESIEILFTPVSVKTAEWLSLAGQNKVKIASSFIHKKELLEYINNHFDIVYMSTGMASLDEIFSAVSTLDKVKIIKVLHCISEYPTGPLLEKRGLRALDEKDARLNMIGILKKMFPDKTIGYSDHTSEILTPVIAVAMGAEIIEKHFTLDRQTPIEHYENGQEYMGTDHILSVEPDKMSQMCSLIRRVETMKGDWKWERSEGEKVLMEFLRGRYKER